jgi:hypothetical protein
MLKAKKKAMRTLNLQEVKSINGGADDQFVRWTVFGLSAIAGFPIGFLDLPPPIIMGISFVGGKIFSLTGRNPVDEIFAGFEGIFISMGGGAIGYWLGQYAAESVSN